MIANKASEAHEMTHLDQDRLLRPVELEAFLRRTLDPEGSLTIEGVPDVGVSNITVFLKFGGRRLVLRRAPETSAADSKLHDMGHEVGFLRALEPAGLPVPRVAAASGDPSVIGAPFYVMDFMDGFTFNSRTVKELNGAGDVRDACVKAVEVLAQLHQVDWGSLDLPATPPSNFLAEEFETWKRQLERIPSAQRLKGMDRVTSWLERNLPERELKTVTTIVHGNYGLHNLMYLQNPLRVAGIVDWETASLGDPATDVVWLVQAWGNREGALPTDANTITLLPGAPSASEMVGLYESATGRPLQNVHYNLILSMWKSSIMCESLYWEATTGASNRPGSTSKFVEGIPAQVELTLDLAESGRMFD
ncbi:hypothetical protein DM793_03150 [Paenarthrobacter nitroguajacolicus]|uniref:phosphotransferase family protein n=1 Tax=Paenarthrobacter nitroguajacolicus TaxID=211146 RepID=UPI0015B95B93|nr:phosphotransferase family protein [Paenarthrobacter nitroguajacolicus]NWL10301.1 hypothetical protein [Paenarthrobacter nitroguajacolicus]